MGKKIGKILGISAPKAAKIKAPAIQKPAEMPDQDQLRRNAEMIHARTRNTGRESTILDDVLG